jgi:hypothetical protein
VWSLGLPLLDLTRMSVGVDVPINANDQLLTSLILSSHSASVEAAPPIRIGDKRGSWQAPSYGRGVTIGENAV